MSHESLVRIDISRHLCIRPRRPRRLCPWQVRAVNSADMAIYHLCVRKKLSEAEMARKAARQLGRSPNAISGWLFQSYSFALRIGLVMHLDLIAAGLLDFFDFMWHAIQVFTLSEQDPLKLRILPGGQ